MSLRTAIGAGDQFPRVYVGSILGGDRTDLPKRCRGCAEDVSISGPDQPAVWAPILIARSDRPADCLLRDRSRDEPHVPERVANLACLNARGRVVRGTYERAPRRHGSFDRGIDVVDLEVEADGRAAERLGPDDVLELGMLVCEVQLRGTDPERRVADPPVGLFDQQRQLGTECLGVEGDRAPYVANRDVWSQRANAGHR